MRGAAVSMSAPNFRFVLATVEETKLGQCVYPRSREAADTYGNGPAGAASWPLQKPSLYLVEVLGGQSHL